MLAYVFYYPMFHNGPLMNFDEFSKQVTVVFFFLDCTVTGFQCVYASGESGE